MGFGHTGLHRATSLHQSHAACHPSKGSRDHCNYVASKGPHIHVSQPKIWAVCSPFPAKLGAAGVGVSSSASEASKHVKEVHPTITCQRDLCPGSLAVSFVIQPISFVNVAICVLKSSPAVSFVICPSAFSKFTANLTFTCLLYQERAPQPPQR